MSEPEIIPTVNLSNLSDEEGFAIGKLINDKYIIEQQLGEGGMGLTYLAYDAEDINRKIVIKTILKILSTPKGKSSFLKEGEALGRINHDGVVKLFDKGEDKETGLPFLVMEYVKGIPLDEVIKRRKMNLKTAVNVTEKIAFALNAAHKEGILHRDLKPANIMIIEDNFEGEKIKLIDFGVAKVADSIVGDATSQVGGFKGTLQYASPEQIEGFQTEAGETFTLACLTYEMLTNVRPFQITATQKSKESKDLYFGRCFQQIKNLQKAETADPKKFNANISDKMSKVILKGLVYDSSNSENGRYQTPVEFAQALRDSFIYNRDFTTVKTFDSADRKVDYKFYWLLGLAALVIVAGGTAAYFYQKRSFDFFPNDINSPIVSRQISETLFGYSFEIQKMKGEMPEGKSFATTDISEVGFGDKFNLIIDREKAGFFYIVKENNEKFNLIFSDNTPKRGKISGWHKSNPDQAIWLIWSEEKIDLLEQKGSENSQVKKFLEGNRNSFEIKENTNKINIQSSGKIVVLALKI